MKLTKEQCSEYRKALDDGRSEMHGASVLDYYETIDLLDTIDALESAESRREGELRKLVEKMCVIAKAHMFSGDYSRFMRDVAAAISEAAPNRKLDLVGGKHDEGVQFDVDEAAPKGEGE